LKLPEVLTYLGLLIAAYGATQEYIRLKMRLALKVWLVVFWFSLLVLYLSTLEPLTDEIINILAPKTFFNEFIWQAKYWIVVSINLIGLFFILKSGQLRSSNQKEFLELIHEIKSSKNEYLIDKLIFDNVNTLIKLRFRKSFIDSLQYPSNGMLQNLSRENKFSFRKTKKFLYRVIKFFRSKHENCVNEIFDNTIENKDLIKKLAKSNEQLGIKILKEMVKNEAYRLQFSSVFLVEAFKNPKSFIHQSMFEKNGGDIGELLFKNQHYEKLDLGLNICWAILDLIEEYSEFMIKSYQEYSDNDILRAIREMMYKLSYIDPSQMHLSNLPYHIQKELLKYTQLDKEYDESVAFSLLLNFYEDLACLQNKIDSKENRIHLLNYLYSSLPNNVEYSTSSMLRLGCTYINYIFGNKRNISLDKAFGQFKQLFEVWQYAYKDNSHLRKMFLALLDERRDRRECEDWIHYRGNKDNQKIWNEMKIYLQEQNNE